jgi:hypothetical protein
MANVPDGAVGTKLLFENENCRVWLLQLEAGHASEWHVHDCDYVYVVTAPGTAITEHVSGSADADDDDHLGLSRYLAPDIGHRLVNTGSSVYENIIVELKGTAHDK